MALLLNGPKKLRLNLGKGHLPCLLEYIQDIVIYHRKEVDYKLILSDTHC